MMNKAPFIGIAGNIGVGKTTFTEVLSKKYNYPTPFSTTLVSSLQKFKEG